MNVFFKNIAKKVLSKSNGKSTVNSEEIGKVIQNLFFGKPKTFTGKDRHDRKANEEIIDALDKDKRIYVKDLKSSRYSYGNSNTLYSDEDVAEQDKEKGNSNTKIKEHTAQSTAIDSIEYNPETQDLDVTFRSGSTDYRLPNVPKEVVAEWLEAPSKGKYYHNVIKDYSINK